MRIGDIVTTDDLEASFLEIYKLMNNIVPNLTLNITSGQIVQDNSMQFPSKYGTMYLRFDNDNLILALITEKVNKVL